MSEPVYLSVNVPNFVTITVMGAVGWAIAAAIFSFLRQNNPIASE
jgi:hypothetical protein